MSDFIQSSSASSTTYTSQIRNKSVTSRPHLSVSDFTESSITCASPCEITISQLNHNTNSSSINASVRTNSISNNCNNNNDNNINNHNHNNRLSSISPSVNVPSINQTKQKKIQRKHNEVLEDPSITHIDSKSGRAFQCKGWIFKISKNRTQKLKLVICDFCESEPPKLVDQCGLRRHLESIHRNEVELKITGVCSICFILCLFLHL